MADVLDARTDVFNFREEARGCFQLAQAETRHEVRVILMGMALEWLRLANNKHSSDILIREPANDR
jgi:hypothetical protein